MGQRYPHLLAVEQASIGEPEACVVDHAHRIWSDIFGSSGWVVGIGTPVGLAALTFVAAGGGTLRSEPCANAGSVAVRDGNEHRPTR